MLIDCHMHPLNDNVKQRAKNSGVSLFFCSGTCFDDWQNVLNFAKNQNDVIAFIGTHPWYADSFNETVFIDYLTKYPDIGIGEIGLDGKKGNVCQQNVFYKQLKTAVLFQRPVIVHCVKAMNIMAPVLKEFSVLPPMIFHAFSGDENDIRFLYDKNVYFSLNASHYRRFKTLLPKIPPHRLLFDTDSPYMLPPSFLRLFPNETENEPSNLSLTLRYAADILNMPLQILEKQTQQNAFSFLSSFKGLKR